MPPTRSRPIVLVVEDDHDVRDLYRTALTAEGFPVVAVEDGLDALRVMERTQPAAVVLDLGLPRLSGLDVAQEMSEQPALRNVPVIIVTGQTTELNPPTRFSCVLRKPIDTDRLIAAVSRCHPAPWTKAWAPQAAEKSTSLTCTRCKSDHLREVGRIKTVVVYVCEGCQAEYPVTVPRS